MATQPVAPVSMEAASTKADDFFNDYFSERELAHVLKKNVRTLRRWHELRVGPPRISVGRTIIYRRAAVARWLEQNESRSLRRKSR